MPPVSFDLDSLITSLHGAIASKRGQRNPGAMRNPVSRYDWGTRLSFTSAGNVCPYLGGGWSEPESELCWTDGTRAEVILPIGRVESDIILTARVSPHVSTQTPLQFVKISIDGVTLGQWTVRQSAAQHALIFNRYLKGKNSIRLGFELPNAFSPQSQGISADPRRLGLAFHDLVLHLYAP